MNTIRKITAVATSLLFLLPACVSAEENDPNIALNAEEIVLTEEIENAEDQLPEETPDPMATPSVSPHIRVIAVQPPEYTSATVTVKPDYDTVLSVLPEYLVADFADGTSGLVSVIWCCNEYDDEHEVYTFICTPENENDEAEDVYPVYTLTVRAASVTPEPTSVPQSGSSSSDSSMKNIKDAAAKLSLENNRASYTGRPITPQISVTYAGTALREGTDYTLSYQDNVEPSGKACAVLHGIGQYGGEKHVYFTIVRTGSGQVYTGHLANTGGRPEGDNYADEPDDTPSPTPSVSPSPTASVSPTPSVSPSPSPDAEHVPQPTAEAIPLPESFGDILFDERGEPFARECRLTVEADCLTLTLDVQSDMDNPIHVRLNREQISRLQLTHVTQIRLIAKDAELCLPIDLPAEMPFMIEDAGRSSFTGIAGFSFNVEWLPVLYWELELSPTECPEAWSEDTLTAPPYNVRVEAVAEYGDDTVHTDTLGALEGVRLAFPGRHGLPIAMDADGDPITGIDSEPGFVLPDTGGVYALEKRPVGIELLTRLIHQESTLLELMVTKIV